VWSGRPIVYLMGCSSSACVSVLWQGRYPQAWAKGEEFLFPATVTWWRLPIFFFCSDLFWGYFMELPHLIFFMHDPTRYGFLPRISCLSGFVSHFTCEGCLTNQNLRSMRYMHTYMPVALTSSSSFKRRQAYQYSWLPAD
jgi:hypothetical protein